MKAVAIWANNNSKKAITLIVVFEILKCSIGFDIGHNFLPVFSSSFVELAALGLVFINTFVQTSYRVRSTSYGKEAQRRFRLFSTGCIMLGSLFLSILMGNHFKGLGFSVSSAFVANAAVSAEADSVQTAGENVVAEKKLTKKHKTRLFAKKTTEDGPHSNRRIGYVLLFLLSVLLTFGALVLTCNLSCGGWAVLAILSFLVSLGIASGGIYFLIKAFQSPVRPLELMTKQEKKKERKRFFTIWALVTGAVGLAFLVLSQ